jgi:hypothetical protein
MSDRLRKLSAWITAAAALMLSGPACACAPGLKCCDAVRATATTPSPTGSCCGDKDSSSPGVPGTSSPAPRAVCACGHLPGTLSPAALQAVVPDVERVPVAEATAQPISFPVDLAPGATHYHPARARAPPHATDLS